MEAYYNRWKACHGVRQQPMQIMNNHTWPGAFCSPQQIRVLTAIAPDSLARGGHNINRHNLLASPSPILGWIISFTSVVTHGKGPVSRHSSSPSRLVGGSHQDQHLGSDRCVVCVSKLPTCIRSHSIAAVGLARNLGKMRRNGDLYVPTKHQSPLGQKLVQHGTCRARRNRYDTCICIKLDLPQIAQVNQDSMVANTPSSPRVST